METSNLVGADDEATLVLKLRAGHNFELRAYLKPFFMVFKLNSATKRALPASALPYPSIFDTWIKKVPRVNDISNIVLLLFLFLNQRRGLLPSLWLITK